MYLREGSSGPLHVWFYGGVFGVGGSNGAISGFTKSGPCAVIGCKLKQNANEGCNICASLAGFVLSFIACFILLVIAPLQYTRPRRRQQVKS